MQSMPKDGLSKIEVRGAGIEEYPIIRDIIARAFTSEDEANLWDYLVAHDPGLRPEGVRVAAVDGRPVACAVVLPRQARGRHGFVPAAIVTIVACDPNHQNQGYASLAVRDSLAYIADQGLAFAMLYGHRSYYPRFGFVPVLPGWYTGFDAAESPAALTPATEADLPALAALYQERVAIYPCATMRTGNAWEWQLRSKEHHAVWTLPGARAYAVASAERAQDALFVHEAAARDATAARELLSGLAGEARRRELAHVRLFMPPDNLVVRTAVFDGDRGAPQIAQTYRPAGAGMVAVCRWESLLPAGYQVSGQGLAYEGRLVLRVAREALTELVIGYRGIDDLLLSPEVALASDGADRSTASDLERLRADFPPSYPKWSLEPFWL